jgi:hypothetical protein
MADERKEQNKIESSPGMVWKCPLGCNLTPWDTFVETNKIPADLVKNPYWKRVALAIHMIGDHRNYELFDELECDAHDPRFEVIKSAGRLKK